VKIDLKVDPKFIPEWEVIKCPSYCALAISPDGKKAVTAGPGADIWDLTTGNLWKKLLATGDSPFGAVAISPDATMALTVSGDTTVRLWEIATGRMIRSNVFGDRPNCIAWSANSPYIAVGAHSLHIIDPETLATKQTVTSGKNGDVTAVAFSAAGTHILFGHDNGVVRTVSVAGTGDRTWYTQPSGTAVYQLPLAGSTILSGGLDKTLHVFDTVKLRRTAYDPKSTVQALAVSPKGTYAVTGGEDKKVRVILLRNGKTVQVHSGHDGAIRALAYSPNSQFFLSTSDDGTLRAWKAP